MEYYVFFSCQSVHFLFAKDNQDNHYNTNLPAEVNNNMLKWEDFKNVDMRVGTVIQVEDFPEARNEAYKLWIDFGDLGEKKSSAQITDLYSKEDLEGRQVIAVVNFPPKQIANFFSECLVLGVVGAEEGVILLQPEREVKNGLRVM